MEQAVYDLIRHGGKHDIYHNLKTDKTEPIPIQDIEKFLLLVIDERFLIKIVAFFVCYEICDRVSDTLIKWSDNLQSNENWDDS